MNISSLGYRFTNEELESLRLIMKLPVPIGIEARKVNADSYNHALESLSDAGLLINAGKQILVDPIIMLLLREVADSRHCLRIRSSDRHTLLHQTPKMFLMSDCTPTNCTLTPLQALPDIQQPLVECLNRHSAPIFVDWIFDGKMQTVEAESEATAATALNELLQQFRIHSAK